MASALPRLVLLIVLFDSCLTLPFPDNQYAYMKARQTIKQHGQAVQAQSRLNPKERVVNLYVEYLRTKEFQETRNFFYPSRPIENQVDKITARSFYKFLLSLPKGGNLHIHEFQILDRRVLLQSIQRSAEQFDMLHICDQTECGANKYYLRFYKQNAPSGWTKVLNSVWTIDAILNKTTLSGILTEKPVYATDTAARWSIAEDQAVFSSYNDLTRYNVTRYEYMKLVLDEALKENVQLLELRRGFFGRTYYFGANGTRINIQPENELETLIRFKKEYIDRNPKFIDFVFVIYGGRISSKENVQRDLNQTLVLQRSYPDLIRGFDLVGEEDLGHTLLFHSDTLIQAFNYSQNSRGSFDLLFHSGETNWPQEYLPSNFGDGVSTFENIYDALVLRSRRIGHGLSFAKRPDLYQYLREKQIAIEICPSSNQILGLFSFFSDRTRSVSSLHLGYVADLRNHPGIVFHRSGIPIVLAGDDPGSFGYNQLTIDFYLATMAWGLDLADLKQLAWNSIQYSSLPQTIKQKGFEKWTNEWDKFIDQTHTLACQQNFTNSVINISHILPTYGPTGQSINITVFGFGFENVICRPIICLFGDQRTNGSIFDINEIICPTPTTLNDSSPVALSIIVNGRSISTNSNYTTSSSLFLSDDGFLDTGARSSTHRPFNIINQLFVASILTVFVVSR